MAFVTKCARTSSLLAIALLIRPGLGLSETQKLTGEWKNPEFNRSAVLRLQIRAIGGQLPVRAFGRCGARECDWGESVAEFSTAGAESAAVRFRVGAATVDLQISPTERGRLRVEPRELPQATTGGSPAGRVDVLTRTGEDCLSHNRATTVAEYWRGGWAVIDRNHVRDHVIWFAGADKEAADRVLAMIKHYGTTADCFVGRPGPSLQYALVRGVSPLGPMPGETCAPFLPGALSLAQRGERWVLADGNRAIFDFAEKAAEAQRSLELIQRYGFTTTCVIGGGRRPYAYLRK